MKVWNPITGHFVTLNLKPGSTVAEVDLTIICSQWLMLACLMNNDRCWRAFNIRNRRQRQKIIFSRYCSAWLVVKSPITYLALKETVDGNRVPLKEHDVVWDGIYSLNLSYGPREVNQFYHSYSICTHSMKPNRCKTSTV